jgi:DHA2 family multidrug resistance protein
MTAIEYSSVPSSERTGYNPWLIAVVVSMATFMEVLDTSIANVSLPHIAGSLSASQDEATWVLTSYLVSNAIILPISGWLATVIGRKRFYMTCVALFAISSLLCGLAPNLTTLIFFRVLQGIGGGGLAPSEQAILTDTFPPRKRGMAFAVYGIAVVVAPAVGPTLGGWITDNFSWRWIFFINVPVGLLSLFLSHLVVVDPPELEARRRKMWRAGLKVDYIGFALVALGLGCLQVVLDKGQEDDWFGSRFITVFIIISAVSLVLCVIRELTTPEPIVDLPLLKDRTFLVSNIVMFMVGFILYGSTVLIPQFLQVLLGYTATDAGLAITPGGFAVMLLMPLVGTLVSKYPAKYLIMFGLAVSSVSLYHMTSFDLQIDYRTVAWARVFQATGLAFLFVPINTAAYAGLPREKSNNASALLNLARNIGGSFGISLVTTIIARRSQFHQSVLVDRYSTYNPAYAAMVANLGRRLGSAGGSGSVLGTDQARGVLNSLMLRQSSMLAYIDAFYVLAVSALVMVPLVLLMRSNKPGKGGGMH